MGELSKRLTIYSKVPQIFVGNSFPSNSSEASIPGNGVRSSLCLGPVIIRDLPLGANELFKSLSCAHIYFCYFALWLNFLLCSYIVMYVLLILPVRLQILFGESLSFICLAQVAPVTKALHKQGLPST